MKIVLCRKLKILGGNLGLSAAPAKWAVFAKRPSYMPGEGWRLLGCGSGTQALPKDEAPSGDIPEELVRQLEKISPA
jgi:hypothetical protein